MAWDFETTELTARYPASAVRAGKDWDLACKVRALGDTAFVELLTKERNPEMPQQAMDEFEDQLKGLGFQFVKYFRSRGRPREKRL